MTRNTKKTKTLQKTRVLNWLRAGKSINALTAWNNLGVYRLSAAIWTLKHKDKVRNIKVKDVTVRNRHGDLMTVASYSIKTSKAA